MIPASWGLLLFGLALTARIGAAIAIGSSFRFADEAIYVDVARRISQGGGFGLSYQQAPGYPVLLLALSFGFPGDVTYLRVSQAVVAASGAVLVFGLADRLFGRSTAIAAGLVYALDPLMVIASALLYPEAAAALLLPIVILTVWEATRRDALGQSAFAGGLLGMVALLRPVALILPLVIAGWLLLPGNVHPLRRLVHVGTLMVAFLLVLVPWTARNYSLRGELVPVAASGTHTAPVSPGEAAKDGLVVSITRWAWRNPARLVSRVARQFVQFWELAPSRLTTDDPAKRQALHRSDPRLPETPLFSRGLRDLVSAGSFLLELALAMVGIAVCARTRWRPTLLVLSVILAWAVGYALFVAKLRYRIPILPLLFVFTGAGAVAANAFIRYLTASKKPAAS